MEYNKIYTTNRTNVVKAILASAIASRTGAGQHVRVNYFLYLNLSVDWVYSTALLVRNLQVFKRHVVVDFGQTSRTKNFSCKLSLAVTKSSNMLFPVLWITSSFHIMAACPRRRRAPRLDESFVQGMPGEGRSMRRAVAVPVPQWRARERTAGSSDTWRRRRSSAIGRPTTTSSTRWPVTWSAGWAAAGAGSRCCVSWSSTRST